MKTLPLFFLTCLLTAVTACSQDAEPLDIAVSGGTTIITEVDVTEFLLSESAFSGDTLFLQAVNESRRRQDVKVNDRIAAFVERFDELSPAFRAGAFFHEQQPRIYPQPLGTEQIIKRLCERYDALTEAAELVIAKRLTSFGTEQSKWKVSTDDKGHVVIDLAKEVNAKRIANLLSASARIGFYETMNVLDAYRSLEALDANYVRLTQTTDTHPILSKLGGVQQGSGFIGLVAVTDTAVFNAMLKTARTPELIRSDLHFVWGFAPDPSSGGRAIALYAIEADNFRVPAIDGRAITYATTGKDPMSGQVRVDLAMTAEGANKWSDMTQANIGRAIAIVFDDKVLSCPNVVNAITDGRTQITGNFTVAQGKELAAFLSSSPLPARMQILDIRTVSGK